RKSPSEHPPVDLAGQVAIVAGGGRGIGRAVALSLASAGASVVVIARTLDQVHETVAAIKGAGGRGAGIPLDVTNDGAVEKMVQRVERETGRVDLLVNSAAMGPPFGPLAEIDAEEWWRCLEVNLRGPLLCARAVLPGMLARRHGRIVNFASGSGTFPVPNLSAYAVSKTALLRFTETLAAETRGLGVSAFAVGPGAVRTSMAEAVLVSPAARGWLPDLARLFDEGHDVPADAAAALVRTLATGRADRLSGRFISIDDDLDAMIERSGEIDRRHLYTLRLSKLD
ncbi:MAG TPA: SDR family oxidoreductase, partial [Verrucomicrobiae bacterium]|nr:SDR family oxidoreductase [Verrucomicrobiae bacterium]